MKFSCLKKYLEKALGTAERFVGKNITLPVLSNILLESKGNSLVITATNLEHAVQISIPGKGSGDGKITVPGKIVNSLIQSVKEEKIDLEGKQDNLIVKTNTKIARINGISSEDFPLLPKIKEKFSFITEGSILSRAVEKVLPAVSSSEFKPELSGVYFNVSQKSIRIAATDTFRLGEKTLFVGQKKEFDSFSFILPQKVTQEITRIYTNNDDVLTVLGDNQIIFKSGGISIISRLIEGNFPDYMGIIPKNFETTCFVNRMELINSIKSCSIFSSKIQDVTLFFKQKNLEVTSLNQDIGEHQVTLPAAVTGKDLKLSFNYRYLLEGLNSMEDEEVFFGCNSENSPSLIHDKSDSSFLYIIMPIRIT